MWWVWSNVGGYLQVMWKAIISNVEGYVAAMLRMFSNLEGSLAVMWWMRSGVEGWAILK